MKSTQKLRKSILFFKLIEIYIIKINAVMILQKNIMNRFMKNDSCSLLR